MHFHHHDLQRQLASDRHALLRQVYTSVREQPDRRRRAHRAARHVGRTRAGPR